MKNSYEIRGDTTAIFIWRKGEKYECLIDTEDLEKLDGFTSTFHLDPAKNTNYVHGHITNNFVRTVYRLHRIIVNAPAHLQVDHINHNGMDNRKCNLRLATDAENMQNAKLSRSNSSGTKGVSWDKSKGSYRAYIGLNYKLINLGDYKNIDLAISARKEAELLYHPYNNPESDNYKAA